MKDLIELRAKRKSEAQEAAMKILATKYGLTQDQAFELGVEWADTNNLVYDLLMHATDALQRIARQKNDPISADIAYEALKHVLGDV